MSLPPLPPSTLYDTRQCLNGHSNDAMREYGQQCREAALEEAAKCAEDYPTYGEATAEEIRILK